MQVAVDASVLVTLLNTPDLWHTEALSLRAALLDADITPVVFYCVVAEAISAATRRLHEKGHIVQVRSLLDRLKAEVPRDTLTWILPDVPRVYPQVLGLIGASSGALNFNDALIALVCRERDIAAIASFDTDFDEIPWLRCLAVPSDVQAGT